MTLIVGIKCRDGIVVGADGCATYGVAGMRTIRQPTTKLAIVAGKAIVGVSGPVGLGQRLQAEVQKALTAAGGNVHQKHSPDAMTFLRRKFAELFKDDFAIAQIMQNGLAPWTRESVLSHSVVALGLSNGPSLIQFDHIFAPEEATATLPFVSIGSGQPIADPFLAFLRHVFWRDSIPSLADGMFGTVWCLRHAIRTNAGGVSDPIQLAVLAKSNGNWEAREVPAAEWDEHEQAAESAEKSLQEWRKTFRAGPAPAVAVAPPPPIPTPAPPAQAGAPPPARADERKG